jgi:hypothetical protein
VSWNFTATVPHTETIYMFTTGEMLRACGMLSCVDDDEIYDELHRKQRHNTHQLRYMMMMMICTCAVKYANIFMLTCGY